MVRFKQFAGSGNELEQSINDWLQEYEPDVTQMVQTVAPNGTIMLSVLYDESFRGQEMRIAEERGMQDAAGRPVPEAAMQDTPIEVPQEPGQYR